MGILVKEVPNAFIELAIGLPERRQRQIFLKNETKESSVPGN